MDLSINFRNQKKNQNWYSKTNFFFHFVLSNSKFARDLQNTQTQTQNPKTQKIENLNRNFWVFLDKNYINFYKKYPILWVFGYGYELGRYTKIHTTSPTFFLGITGDA